MQPLVDTEKVATRKGKPIILCVDDVKEVLDTLDEQLNAHLGKQFTIESCLSGEEALEVIEDNMRKGREIAVIIADVIMPGMKGDELLIRAHQMTPATLNIMLTGEAGTVQHVTNAINKAKLYRFINKPWDMKDMQLTIEEAAKSYLQKVTIEEQNRVLRTLHDASQVIARQVDLRDIYGEMMRLMLRYSGADKAVLALKNDNRLKLHAMAQANLPTQILDGEELEAVNDAPQNILLRVAETQTPIAQGNATQDGDFARDPYITKFQIRSFLAFPLINLGKLIGVVYLENRVAANTFSQDRIDVINILASQAAIAIDNGFLYEHLEDEVYRRTKELMAANSHKDKILNIVSHEIRGPLGGIAELAGLLKDPEFARNADEVTRYAELIQTNTSRVVKLANDILELARLETGGTDGLKRTPIDLTHFITSLVPVFQSMTLTKNITLVVDAPDQIELKADAAKLGMALSNLINNALKFTPKGGEVTISTRRLEQAGKTFAEIKVIDTGLGIPAEQLPKVFEKFGVKQRLGTAGEKGTGLGLSLVKEVIAQHEGKIDVQSGINKGTTFTILLPLE